MIINSDRKNKVSAGGYYTIEETQRILGYKSKNSVQYLIKNNYLKAYVVGGTPKYKVVKICGKDIIRFIDSREL